MNIPDFSERIYEELEKLDIGTFKHCTRVSVLCEIVEEELGLDNRLSMSAKVHDIGKIFLAERINNKRGIFTDTEKAVMGLHPYLGYLALAELGAPEDVRFITLFHHGFNPPGMGISPITPDDDIKLYSNILHTVDTWEALMGVRNYRSKNLTQEEAVEVLESLRYANPDVLALAKSGKLVL